ncbi:MAG: hypothetical protein GWN53_17235 [Gammaproteobacteria bacterium]|uniref:Hint domain-containing protein n=1 Tax=Candidatus Kutchimonas denitrificans TaxID=3056748 RepID=A0AAE4ZB38_9BACT|nr:hypothetical protein [Candidatus Kutchimonas denitrificans]NIV53586.1 hypothetical protein [Gammaproteobacteria bacterium]
MPFDPGAYTRRILAARRLHLALDARALRELRRLLTEHANELARRIANLPAGDARTRTIAARRITEDLYARLARDLERLTEDGVRLQFTTIKREMDRATVEAIRAAEQSVSAVFQPRPPAQSAAAYLARGDTAEVFRTLDAAVDGAAAGTDELIAEALARGWSPERLARRIRPYVLGQTQFSAEELRDLRRVPMERREASRQLQFNARRIAITEMGNAVHEAQIQNMIEAPMVEAWRWRLSPVRGTQQGKPDVCDILASFDAYGIGGGLYPVRKVPRRPHPFDRSVAAWTPVLTRSGWKSVNNICEGEQVMTHKGRWRSVKRSIHGRRTGDWVKLRTTSGQELYITTDHPVLTSGGKWLFVGDLSPGDLVVCLDGFLNDDVKELTRSPLRLGDVATVDYHQRPALAIQLLGLPAVLVDLFRRTMPPTVDFYGELGLGDGDVDVESADGPQSFGGYAKAVKLHSDCALVDGKLGLVLVDRLCAFFQYLFGDIAPSEKLASMLRSAFAFFRKTLVPKTVRLTLATGLNVHFEQAVTDRPSIHPQPLSYNVFGQQFVDIEPPNFVEVEIESLTHVPLTLRRYCLTVVEDNSFVAAGVVVHNCWGQSETRPVERWQDPKPEPGIERLPTIAAVRDLFNPDQTQNHIERQTLLARRVIREASASADAAA